MRLCGRGVRSAPAGWGARIGPMVPCVHSDGMSSRPNDPRRVDVQALAIHDGVIEGVTPLTELRRLRDPNDDPAALVHWRARASRRERPGAAPLVHLHLEAQADVVRTCQRCLEPMPIGLRVDRRLRFVRGEAEAARLDAASDEDVLALEPALDVLALIEDELVLELPLVPRHERCVDLSRLGSPQASGDHDTASHPFQALEALKVPKAH
jgi:uncharacterized protein